MDQHLTLLPEEETLAQLKGRLAALEEELADRELELATLRRELAEFLAYYLACVGTRIADLDRIEAELASRYVHEHPTPEAEEDLRDAQRRAENSTRALGDDPDALVQAASQCPLEPPAELKVLYRRAAKAVHPDLATDDEDRGLRERLMAEVNEAYASRDAEHLQAILDGWRSRPEAVLVSGVGAELVRVIRAIAAIDARLGDIAGEMRDLVAQDLYSLLRRNEEAREAGRNLLDEMATELDERIARARVSLGRLTSDSAGEGDGLGHA